MDPEGHSGGVVGALRASLLGGDLRYTSDQVASTAGVDRELTRRLWRAMGFADVPADEVAFTDQDLEALRRSAALIDRDGLGPDDLLHLARVLGQASARMADSVVGLSVERLGQVPTAGHLLPSDLLTELDGLVVYLLNRHLLDSVDRHVGDGLTPVDAAPVTVGFADLVGFTRVSQSLGAVELAALVEEFETVASDTVVVNGGRVVKMIGDEVMFAAPGWEAVEIALLLSESFDDPDMPTVRVGLARGSVITRAGDLFGPTVNLAARTTTMARPGSVLVAEELFEAVEADERYSLKRLRPRRLKGIGWANLAAVTRRSPDGPARPPARSPAPPARPPTPPARPPARPPAPGAAPGSDERANRRP